MFKMNLVMTGWDAEMNATFDNGEIKAFNFSGVYTSNVTTSDHGLGTGDVTYTVSYWFKRIRKRNTYDYLYIMGNGGSVGQASLMWILNEQLTLDHWSTQTRYFEPIQNNRWYHVAAGHRGGEAVTNDFLFIDGQNVGVSVSTPQPFDLQGSKLTLGTSHNSVNEFLQGFHRELPPLQPSPDLRRDLATLRLPEGVFRARGLGDDPQGGALGDWDFGA
jgi:hypothetical protein